jgi:hypothetical protein
VSVRYRIEAEGGVAAVVVAGQALVIGSSEKADLRLDGEVALRHARLAVDKKKAELEVVRGEEARINGVTVTGKRVVRDGDEIEVGGVLLKFNQLAPTDEVPASELLGSRAPIPVEHALTPPPPVEKSEALQLSEAASTALARARIWWPEQQIPPLEVQHVWFALEKDDSWRSLAIVPTDDRVPCVAIAHGFGRMACMNPHARVLVVDASSHGGHEGPPVEQPGHAVVRFPQAGYDFLDASALGLGDAELAHVYVPRLLEYLETAGERHDRVIIALGSVIEHTQSIPIARAVDAVVLAVGVGHSVIDAVKKSAEIVGKERIQGSMALEYE